MKRKTESAESINARLKAANIPVRVRHRGNSLFLRATLPPKPGTGHTKKQAYDISLGIPASADGFKRVEAEAHALGSLITRDRFEWVPPYLQLKPSDNPQTVSEWISKFREFYTSTHSLSDRTWEKHWQKQVFDRLPQKSELNAAILLATALTTDPHTRLRKQVCQKLQTLADFAKIDVNLKIYKGEYGQSKVKPRKLPTDEEIVKAWDLIPNAQWRTVYGLLACFGLRSHETLFCRFINPQKLEVDDGKTGGRIARAMRPEWSEMWNLIDGDLPKITGRNFEDYGQRINTQFRRYKIPFNPYDLRHAWCVRGSIIYRLPTAVMASWAGHSPEVHVNIYNKWISQATHEQVYEEMVLDDEG